VQSTQKRHGRREGKAAKKERRELEMSRRGIYSPEQKRKEKHKNAAQHKARGNR
jgi:hypothetical protein